VWAVDARVVRRATRLRAAIDDAGALYDAARLHAVRVALKKLRYAAELSAEARGLNRTAELSTLKRAQDTLGRLHDFEILRGRVQRVRDETTGSTGFDVREFESLTGAIERECRRLHAAFMRDRAELSAITGRLGNQGAGRALLRPRRAG
jgi:CHAD domain-containing protein